ncbi:hypothetical protein V6B08_12425 [Ferrovibrio sp. MS7]|jgi:predicted RNA methylase|uniref:hypothetical protein n=1 Tax=Ferrovibrio TaxID=1231242 RepID=UPI001B5C568D|nr:hypothetical protein [Ferrovibrio sp.]
MAANTDDDDGEAQFDWKPQNIRPIAAQQVIAEAIKAADTSYFFENYTKQSNAVIKALRQSGYVIVPYYPTVDMVRAAMEELQYGSNKFTNVVMPMYLAMMKAAPKSR